MTNTVQIRRYRPDDVDALYDAVVESHAELSRWLPWCHPQYSRDDTSTWVAGRPGDWERNAEWSFLIVDDHDRLLGGCGLHRLDVRSGVGELGYWVRTGATGRGVATTATRQLCDWAFAEQGLARIEVLVAVENLASQQVARKVGGVREGVLRERVPLHGVRRDCVLFSVLKSEFRR